MLTTTDFDRSAAERTTTSLTFQMEWQGAVTWKACRRTLRQGWAGVVTLHQGQTEVVTLTLRQGRAGVVTLTFHQGRTEVATLTQRQGQAGVVTLTQSQGQIEVVTLTWLVCAPVEDDINLGVETTPAVMQILQVTAIHKHTFSHKNCHFISATISIFLAECSNF